MSNMEKRESGILMPVFSLPSRYGIGCFSKEAYAFIDMLKEAGQKKWQILPLGPTGCGDSPYQSFSAFAGNPYFINLEELKEEGLLTDEELSQSFFGSDPEYVDYGALYENRFPILRKAFSRFHPGNNADYRTFLEQNDFWLDDYCLYMALKDAHGGKPWQEWEKELAFRNPAAVARAKQEFSEEMDFYRFQQFFFQKHWFWVHSYAESRGVQIIGDIPIYMAFDSADTWSHPELFKLSAGLPEAVAGCPPDYFSPTGQLWGNPLYDWDSHRASGYSWWVRRIRHTMGLCDMLRIDHFRGFDEYYSIPYGDPTAENGKWLKGPGIELFQTIESSLGRLDIIAEDLGTITDSARTFINETGYPGMKVLEFAFDAGEASDHLPYRYDRNCIVYTGTHDNDTIRGWFGTLDSHDRAFALRYLNAETLPADQIPFSFIKLAMASVARLCIIPVQDYLGLGSEARINAPATSGGNWKWRLREGEITKSLIADIRDVTKLYGR